jgi:hypothetical protein
MVDVTEHHPLFAFQEAEKAAALETIVPQFYAFGETVRYVIGCDLGQSSDPTAIAVLEHSRGVVDHGNSFQRNHGLSKQTPAERTDCRHLERLPLGTSYPAVVQRVKDLLSRPPLNGHDGVKPAELVLDATGVGQAVADVFDEAGLPHIRVTITAGVEVTAVARNRWHVSKSALISTVDALLHLGELRFAAALSESGAMRDELLDFRRSLSAAGRATYAARTGKHDDLVLAVAIGCWWLGRPLPPKLVLGGY